MKKMVIDMYDLKKIIPVFIFFIWFIVAPGLYSQTKEAEKSKEDEKSKIERYFKMSLHEMMEVEIITASRTPEKVSDIPASVVLITRQDIETYGYRTLTEILENIPGLYPFNDYAEGGTNFGVRGFWSGVPNDNMVILVNGISHVDDFQSNYPLKTIAIPVESIDRIEVIRGPMSVIYGNGAFYGVINIFTNEIYENNSLDETTHIVSSSFGSEKTKKVFLRTASQNGDFKYVVNASLYDTYGMNHPLRDMVKDPKVLPGFGVPEDQTTGGRLEANEEYFNFFGSFKNLYLNLSYGVGDNEIYFLLPSVSKGHLDKNYSTSISVGYKKEFSRKITIDGKLSFFQNRTWQEFNFLSENFYGIQQYESSAWETDINMFFVPSHNIELKSGLYYRSILNVSNMYDLPSFGSPTLENNYYYLKEGDNIITQAFYTQMSYNPFPNLSLVAGLRLEQLPKYGLEAILAGGTKDYKKVSGIYNQDKIEVIPRLAAIYKLNDKNIFKFLYGKAINRPSFFQNSKNSLDPLIDDLMPEKIQTLELNYISAFSSKFTLSTSLFRNVLENLITRVVKFDDEGNYQSWSANAGKMITQGIELTINAEFLKNFRLELSGTFQETDDKRSGYQDIKTAYSPNFLGYLKAAYRTKKFTFAITGNYVDGMETYWDETIENADGSYGNRIGDRVESYFIIGANTRIENLFIKGLYLNIRCSNLLDEEIRYPTFTNNQWADRGTIGIGRTFLVSIGYKF